jgi:hypothetical protein
LPFRWDLPLLVAWPLPFPLAEVLLRVGTDAGLWAVTPSGFAEVWLAGTLALPGL